MGRITETVKHLLIINGIVFLATSLYGNYLYENRVGAQLYGDPYTKDYHPQDPNKKPAAYNSLFNLF